MNWLRRLAGQHRRILGRRGERRAARFLRRRGYRILHRNLTIGRDEADLVALDPDGRTIVIVEVKTRSSDYLAPEVKINRDKQYRLARLAAGQGLLQALRGSHRGTSRQHARETH